jgi:ascorbate-specific PTS system EIIC-type component UlaA
MMSQLEAFLVGIVGTLVAVYVLRDLREPTHDPFSLIAFFVALIFYGTDAAVGPITQSRHFLAAAISLTALTLILGRAKE